VRRAQVLREAAIALGLGPKRPRERRAPRPKQGTEGEDVVPGAGGGMQLRLPPRFGAGTLKAAAWHVRARVYTAACERGPAGAVARCASGAARGPGRRGQTRGGAQGCPVAPRRLLPRMPGAARAMSAHAMSRSGSPAFLRVVLGLLTMRSTGSIAAVQSKRMLPEHWATPAQRAAPPGSGGMLHCHAAEGI